ncbi:MAG: potassium/proton antiporter [Alphaproteobacteria bacterium]|nr:potassium/proton antiporter [Alphaproteobacteria bacterium]
MDFINVPILLFSLVLSLSILTSLISNRANIPMILVFLCLGLVVGNFTSVTMFPTIQNPRVAFFIGSLALALILFDGGYQTSLRSLKKAFTPSCLLATVGVLLTALLLLPAAKVILGLSWMEALLLASIIGSTDSASVFFLLRKGGVVIRDKIRSTLEIESGSNDPMAIFLTLVCINILLSQSRVLSFGVIMDFALQMGVGCFVGVLLAYGTRLLINKINLDTALYPILVISLMLVGFSVTAMLSGSGFFAIYIAGILLGNSRLKGGRQIARFQSTFTWLSQIILFLTLGFFADMTHFAPQVGASVLLSLFLIFIARPIAVFLCLLPFQYTFKEMAFISFVGLRGATAILLALLPLVMQMSVASSLFNVIFLMVLMSLTIQGLFIIPVAKLCGVIVPSVDLPPMRTEIDLPGLQDSYLITYQLTEKSPAVLGAKIPRWARPVVVHRDDIAYNGNNIKTLKAGDQIYLFMASDRRRYVLDKLFGGGAASDEPEGMGDFVLSPDILLDDLHKMYGVRVSARYHGRTLREILTDNFSDLEVGDHFSVGSVELIVRRMENGNIVEIGLDLDPDRKNRHINLLASAKKVFAHRKKNT